jgi:hypothetical protein
MRKDENDSTIHTRPSSGNGKINGASNGHAAPSRIDLAQLSLSELHDELAKTDDLLREGERHGPELESRIKPDLIASRVEILRELERRWAPIPPVDVDNEQHAEPQEVEFPAAAWTGLFRDWRDIVAPCTEAALEKLWSAMLVAVGLMLGRNVYIENPLRLYPNFYILLVGQTGYARKSTVLRFAEQLLSHIDDDVEVIRGFVSTEGIFEVLAKDKGTRALGYADEWRSLLSVAKRRGTLDILPKMNSLYGCPFRDEITRRDKSTIVESPFFSFISATPLEYAEKLLGNEEIAGGVLNRYLIVSGKEQPPKPLVEPPFEQAWQSISRPLRETGERWAKKPHCFTLDPEAKDLYCKFYIALRRSMDERDAREVQLTSRIDEHVLKIALVYSAVFGETKITRKALAIAIAIGRWLQASTLSIFGDVGLDSFTKAQKEILKVVEKRGYIYRRDLQRLLSKKINGELFGRALRVLDTDGFIKCHDGRERTPFGAFLGGQVRPWIEYIRQTPDTYLRAQ